MDHGHNHDAHLDDGLAHDNGHHHEMDDQEPSHSQSWFDTLGKFAAHVASDIAADAVAEHVTDLLGDKAHYHSDDHVAFVGDQHDAGFTSQVGEKTCSVVAQKMVMDQFGVVNPDTGAAYEEHALVNQAVHHGWLTETGGTTIEHMGKVMEFNGVANHHGETWEDLFHDLSLGHRVVAAVSIQDMELPLWQQLLDVLVPIPGLQQEHYNHVVVLKGIEMGADGQMEVVVNDPGLEQGANRRISPDHLRDALGKMHYVATDQAPMDWHQHQSQGLHDVHGDGGDDTFAEMISKLNDEDRFDFLRNI